VSGAWRTYSRPTAAFSAATGAGSKPFHTEDYTRYVDNVDLRHPRRVRVPRRSGREPGALTHDFHPLTVHRRGCPARHSVPRIAGGLTQPAAMSSCGRRPQPPDAGPLCSCSRDPRDAGAWLSSAANDGGWARTASLALCGPHSGPGCEKARMDPRSGSGRGGLGGCAGTGSQH
jgi:hypothetical protein